MKICVEISGALVQNIYAIGVGNVPVEVDIIDFDLDEDWMETYEGCAERAKRLADFRANPDCRHIY